MSKGIFDRLLYWLDPKSPLRSDRMMGLYATTAMIVATAAGWDWSSAQDMATVNYINELFSGASGIVTSIAAMVGTLGAIRAHISDREF